MEEPIKSSRTEQAGTRACISSNIHRDNRSPQRGWPNIAEEAYNKTDLADQSAYSISVFMTVLCCPKSARKRWERSWEQLPMRLRAQGHPRENIENEILSEFRYMTIGARRNVEEHGTCFSRLRSYARIRGCASGLTPADKSNRLFLWTSCVLSGLLAS